MIRKLIRIALLAVLLSIAAVSVCSQEPASVSKVWVADRGDGTYRNPIINADYSDPDVVRVGDTFYMTSSSFNAVPGLPILRSYDLVNWSIVNHVFKEQEPVELFRSPQHGNGVWAPSIRYHNGEFYIFYGDPDQGIFMTKAKDPLDKWTKPLLIKAAKGWIDPCPFWDDDGNAYLVHAFAGSRAGIKSILVVNRMSADGETLLDGGTLVFDGHENDATVEGPKLYKKDGYYYILAPAGGVATGWQLALRSKNIFGPYERKVVLAQGTTTVNGPHQGALVDTPTGEWWFLHFQDRGPYGRVVLLQPVTWSAGFPVIGKDADGDGAGEPVLVYKKPNVGKKYPITSPADSDEFNAAIIGPQWQWQANSSPEWAFPFPSAGLLKMFSVQTLKEVKNLWDVPNLLLQKFPAEEFSATVKVRTDLRFEGETFALTVMGMDYAYVGVALKNGTRRIIFASAKDADKGNSEAVVDIAGIGEGEFYLRVTVTSGAKCQFSYSRDGKKFTEAGDVFTARQGRWIGAKLGLFFNRPGKFNDAGSADIDWFRIDKP